jgi:amino acid transporter
MSQVKSQVKKYNMITDIVSTITEMVTGVLGGLGESIVGFFEALFVADGGISSLGIWVIALIGLAVALGAVAWVSTLIRGKQR